MERGEIIEGKSRVVKRRGPVSNEVKAALRALRKVAEACEEVATLEKAGAPEQEIKKARLKAVKLYYENLEIARNISFKRGMEYITRCPDVYGEMSTEARQVYEKLPQG